MFVAIRWWPSRAITGLARTPSLWTQQPENTRFCPSEDASFECVPAWKRAEVSRGLINFAEAGAWEAELFWVPFLIFSGDRSTDEHTVSEGPELL